MAYIKERNYQFYDTAVSICSTCLERVDGKIVFQDGAVWLLKRCPEHGHEKVMLADDIDYYRRAREVFIKTPEQSQCYNTRLSGVALMTVAFVPTMNNMRAPYC